MGPGPRARADVQLSKQVTGSDELGHCVNLVMQLCKRATMHAGDLRETLSPSRVKGKAKGGCRECITSSLTLTLIPNP